MGNNLSDVLKEFAYFVKKKIEEVRTNSNFQPTEESLLKWKFDNFSTQSEESHILMLIQKRLEKNCG